MAESPRRTLEDLMQTLVVAVDPAEPVANAAAAMVRHRVGSALVMEGRYLAGILTERDVLRAAASGEDLTRSPASGWMTKDPETASPGTLAEEAVQLMLLRGFRHLPVCEGHIVLGVVSLRDLAAAQIRRPAPQG